MCCSSCPAFACVARLPPSGTGLQTTLLPGPGVACPLRWSPCALLLSRLQALPLGLLSAVWLLECWSSSWGVCLYWCGAHSVLRDRVLIKRVAQNPPGGAVLTGCSSEPSHLLIGSRESLWVLLRQSLPCKVLLACVLAWWAFFHCQHHHWLETPRAASFPLLSGAACAALGRRPGLGLATCWNRSCGGGVVCAVRCLWGVALEGSAHEGCGAAWVVPLTSGSSLLAVGGQQSLSRGAFRGQAEWPHVTPRRLVELQV